MCDLFCERFFARGREETEDILIIHETLLLTQCLSSLVIFETHSCALFLPFPTCVQARLREWEDKESRWRRERDVERAKMATAHSIHKPQYVIVYSFFPFSVFLVVTHSPIHPYEHTRMRTHSFTRCFLFVLHICPQSFFIASPPLHATRCLWLR